ncbi:MAG: orotidine 5'-phosphate decarboxylase / HUMPS family protein [archaeon]
MTLIHYRQSIIPALDQRTEEEALRCIEQTTDLHGIGGYKVGAVLNNRYGMERLLPKIRERTALPIIYDHQKGGTDTPFQAEPFMDSILGVDAVILFPLSGPVTLEAWVKAAQERHIHLLVGGDMTAQKYFISQGGYIKDSAPEEIFSLAAKLGVRDFVIPGTKLVRAVAYAELLTEYSPVLYSPGLGVQGGEIHAYAQAFPHWHAFVGRTITQAENPREKAKELISMLRR